jgi:hypothetical protein
MDQAREQRTPQAIDRVLTEAVGIRPVGELGVKELQGTARQIDTYQGVA